MNLEEHQILLSDWQERYPDGMFISDGPIDASRWRNTKRRVLFLAKEAYGDTGPGGLPQLLKEWDGPKHKFWWTLGYWAYGIQRLSNGRLPSNPKYEEEWNEVKESVLASAVVNIKKAHGRSRSEDDDLREYIRGDGDLLRQQVESLGPHIVVCCNTWHLVEELWPHAVRISEQVLRIDGMVVLDFWHPANHYPDVLCYYAALALLQRVL